MGRPRLAFVPRPRSSSAAPSESAQRTASCTSAGEEGVRTWVKGGDPATEGQYERCLDRGDGRRGGPPPPCGEGVGGWGASPCAVRSRMVADPRRTWRCCAQAAAPHPPAPSPQGGGGGGNLGLSETRSAPS